MLLPKKERIQNSMTLVLFANYLKLSRPQVILVLQPFGRSP